MSDENEIKQAESENVKTEAETEYDRQIEKLDSFFSAIQPGVSLLIERLKPSWCSGLLEEIVVTDELIDLPYFINTWGGQLLSVKIRGKRGQFGQGSYKIPLYSYPPLRFGEKIYPYDKTDRFSDIKEKTDMSTPVVVNAPQSKSLEKIFASLPAILPFVLKWFESVESRRQHDLAVMMQLANSKNQNSGISDISQIGTMMTQLSEVFKKTMGVEQQSDMDFIPQALDVVKMILGQKNQTTKPAKIVGPQDGPPNMQYDRSKIMPLPSRPTNVVESICDMDAKQAAETIIESLGKMDIAKREQAIGHFLNEYTEMADEDDDIEDDQNNRGYR